MATSIFSSQARLLRLVAVPVVAFWLVANVGASAFACVTPPPPPPPPTTSSCVDFGAAAAFAVLAGSAVTNTGPSVISGHLGVSPGTAVTGFPPGLVTNGIIHSADSATAAAKLSLAKAYTDTAALPSTADVAVELGNKTFGPGVYDHTTLGINGTVTLNANGNPNAIFVFRSASTLITGSGSNVSLINGAKASNVCWLAASSATLGTNSQLAGTVMAYASVTATTGVSVTGRLLAKTAAVTLNNNKVTLP
jgi:Ice-binding-like